MFLAQLGRVVPAGTASNAAIAVVNVWDRPEERRQMAAPFVCRQSVCGNVYCSIGMDRDPSESNQGTLTFAGSLLASSPPCQD